MDLSDWLIVVSIVIICALGAIIIYWAKINAVVHL